MIYTKKPNYLAVSNALLFSTMLSNNFNEALEQDTNKIIDFVSSAFKLAENDVARCKKLFSDELTILSTTKDVDAYLTNQGDKDYPEISDFLYLKSQVLLKINNIHDSFTKANFNQFYFDYSYLRSYYPEIRFKELEASSTKGNVDINRTVAMMLVLGIGCERNVESGIYRFKQCAYWGDTSSFVFLAYLYETQKDEKNAKLYGNLVNLRENLKEGRTLIPENLKPKYDKLTIQTYQVIASIVQDIVYAYEEYEIDYSFLEAIFMEKLDYFKKMELINDYRRQRKLQTPLMIQAKDLAFQ